MDAHAERPAVFRKILSAAKGKHRGSNIKYDEAGTSAAALQRDEEFERRKQHWQEELEEMSEFLLIKSAQEQRDDGVEHPVDTAYIDDRDGMPILKAVFDVHHFKSDDIELSIEDDRLTLEAVNTDARDDCVFRKRMIRTLDLPKFVDHKMMHCHLSDDGIVTIEMPFHLPPQRRPSGPNVYPIQTDDEGRRKITLAFAIGKEFTTDDVKVESNGRKLTIRAFYDAEIGKYAQQQRQRELKREYNLPDYIEVDTVSHVLTPEGKLFIQVMLKDEKPYKCEVTSEEQVTGLT